MSAQGRIQTVLLTQDQYARLDEIATRWACSRSEVVRRLISDVRETEIYLGSPAGGQEREN